MREVQPPFKAHYHLCKILRGKNILKASRITRKITQKDFFNKKEDIIYQHQPKIIVILCTIHHIRNKNKMILSKIYKSTNKAKKD